MIFSLIFFVVQIYLNLCITFIMGGGITKPTLKCRKGKKNVALQNVNTKDDDFL